MSHQDLAALGLLGAGAAVTGLALLDRRVETPSLWYNLTFPRDLDPDRVVAFLRSLASDRRRHVLALELVYAEGCLVYRIGIAERHQAAVLAQLRSHLPGVSARLVHHHVMQSPEYAWQLHIVPRYRALQTTELQSVTRALITAVYSSSDKNTILLQWLLGPRLAPTDPPAKGTRSPGSTWSALLRDAVVGASKVDADAHRLAREKTCEPGFRAILRIGVTASSPQAAKSIAVGLLAALRTAEAPGVHLSLRKDSPDKLAHARSPRSWPLAVNIKELALLTGWPYGDQSYPGIPRSGAQLLRANESIASRGRIVAEGTHPETDRLLALTIKDSLQHLHILGPTGVGKSNLMLNMIVQDIAAGRGVAVIDPKGDLVDDVLGRIPEDRTDDIVVLDPADQKRPVGLNVLEGGERPAELVADQVLAVFHELYRENWGPRTQDILHASLLTLAARPGMTLCALPILLSNRSFRCSITKGLSDKIALGPFWHWYDSLSDGERQQAIAPVMNKLRAFLLRPWLRAVIGQPHPAFDVHRVFSERKVLLVSLAKGLLGPEAAALLGSLVVSEVWQATLGRVRVPSARRSPVFVYIDEFQDYLHLPTDVADVLAQARGLGLGLTLAHQHLAQLPNALRSAVLSNARSRVCFQLGHEDAKLIAGTSGELSPLDLQSLGRYEAYISLVAKGSVTPFASGRTVGPPDVVSDSQRVRASSRERYGRNLEDVEAAIAAQMESSGTANDNPIGRRRAT